jgi:hypothetical protein
VGLRPASCAPSSCDADSDGIADVVEEAICGSSTCASGQEDLDGDGVRDAEELEAQLPRDDAEAAPDDGSTWAVELPGGMYLRPGSLALVIYGLAVIVTAVVVVITLRRQRAAAGDQQ